MRMVLSALLIAAVLAVPLAARDHVAGRVVARMSEWVQEWGWHGHAALEEGKALRIEAIAGHSLAKHMQANAAFERAAAAGLAAGEFFRAQAKCQPGWDLEYDPQTAWADMREAAMRDSRLQYLLADPDICGRAAAAKRRAAAGK